MTGLNGNIAIADTLVFVTVGKSGRAHHHETVQNAPHIFHSVYVRFYEWKNGVLNFYAPCPRDAVCAPALLETGRLGGDTLTITYDHQLLRERTYQRLP